MKKFNCLFCGTENNWTYSSSNKYCSNVCQQEHRFKKRIDQWLNEGKDWSLAVPKWVSKHLADVNGYHCSVCNISNWNEKEIVLEVDHIDGNHYNNNINNLRLICPNCHSQTETYKNKNKGNGRHIRLSRYHDNKTF